MRRIEEDFVMMELQALVRGHSAAPGSSGSSGSSSHHRHHRRGHSSQNGVIPAAATLPGTVAKPRRR
jgi:hypothetical protein